MNILLTGSGGFLGKRISSYLENAGLNYSVVKYTDDLSQIDWNPITHVINSAAVVPSGKDCQKEYMEANARFVHRLMLRSRGKFFIHFGTHSQYYRLGYYQLSKVLGCAMLMDNRHLFSDLEIIRLPTLDDKVLIENIVEKARADIMPVVDRLRYLYCSPEDVARYVVEGVLLKKNVKMNVVEKDLYDEVQQIVGEQKIVEGKLIDRVCFDEGFVVLGNEIYEGYKKEWAFFDN